MITTRGLELDYNKFLANKYTHIYKVQIGPEEKSIYVYCYMIDRKKIIIPTPRYIPIKYRLGIKKNEFNLTFKEKPIFNHNQKVILRHIYKKNTKNNFAHGNKINIILDTGQGKTYIAIGLIMLYKVKTLYIVNRKNSLDKKYNTFIKYFNCNIGRVGDGYDNKENITIGVINSLLKKNLSWFDFGMVFFDEMPVYFSKSRIKIFFKCNSLHMYGLTAEPENDKIKYAHEIVLGEYLYCNKLKGFVDSDIKFKGSIRKVEYSGITRDIKNSYTRYNSAIQTINTLHMDHRRIYIILQEIDYLLFKGYNMYIFSEIVSYLLLLYNKCISTGKCLLTGKMKKGDPNTARIIFTTYAFGEKELSYNHMDSIIYVTSRRSGYIQSSGRILRIDGDIKKKRKIIDIVDKNLFLSKQFSSRKETYIFRDFKIKSITYDSFNFKILADNQKYIIIFLINCKFPLEVIRRIIGKHVIKLLE